MTPKPRRIAHNFESNRNELTGVCIAVGGSYGPSFQSRLASTYIAGAVHLSGASASHSRLHLLDSFQ
jgi:hypothetical protein